MIRSFFDVTGALIITGVFLLLFLIESRYALRKRVQGRWKRLLINFLLSLPAFALLRFLLIPAMVWVATKNQSWHLGVINLFEAPLVLKSIVAFMLLDYTNYIWHFLLHNLPFLWRFHLVHHTDLDLDVTTAFRFHFGEMITSVVFRGATVLLTGASPMTVLIYEICFEAAAQFHHSNTRLPLHVERIINYLIVTPRMHGIHHSVIKRETDSNYSVIFSVWDRLHNTSRREFEKQVLIGVPSYADPKELTVKQLLILPFKTIRGWGEKSEATKK
jgi:sterol desaturase/sphingolipid hydroxylase (fatty acid hydroxylase superfamily)